jgi:signal transduction histidine kinase
MPAISRDLEPLDLAAWLRVFAEEVRDLAAPASVLVSVPDAPIVAQFEKDSLHDALLNLVLNAREAGARRIVLHVENGVFLVVEDDGCGMTEYVRARIFEPLFSTRRAAIGLGLPVVDQTIRAHGGRIIVQSAPGKGTRVCIALQPAVGGRSAASAERHAEPTGT